MEYMLCPSSLRSTVSTWFGSRISTSSASTAGGLMMLATLRLTSSFRTASSSAPCRTQCVCVVKVWHEISEEVFERHYRGFTTDSFVGNRIRESGNMEADNIKSQKI